MIWKYFWNIEHSNYEKYGILLPKLFWPTVRKNCSSDREKLWKFEAEGREFANFLRSLEQFIQTFENGRLFLGELRPRKNAFEVFWPLANILKLFIYFLFFRLYGWKYPNTRFKSQHTNVWPKYPQKNTKRSIWHNSTLRWIVYLPTFFGIDIVK